MASAQSPRPLRVAVVGKGGAGKSVVAGTLARVLARRGHRVLALDSDLMPGLALSLGSEQPPTPPLLEAAEKPEGERWRLRKGIGPARAVARYSTPAPDGIRLLQCGKTPPEGLGPIMGAVNAYYSVIHRLPRSPSFAGWTLVGDLPAGPRQTAFDWAPYADTFLVLVEPTWKSVLTAKRIARIARSRPGVAAAFVANKVARASDAAWISRRVREPVVAAVPLDDAVLAADRAGVALLDHAPGSPAVRAVEKLVDELERRARLAA